WIHLPRETQHVRNNNRRWRFRTATTRSLLVCFTKLGREVVVLCHGFKSDKNNTILKNVAAAIEKEGISSFRFDFSGNGESEGGFNYGNYKYEADDLHSVIQHFSNTNRVVTTIIRHSKGGNVVLLYASKYCNDGNVRNIISISGRYDLKKGIRLGDG
ncbi:unnamed protein product, partial [Brassica oleracea var. botrytis]